MKTIYSLREFKDEVLKLAQTVNEDFCSVKVEISHNDVVEFSCYVSKYGLHDGKTMEQCLDKLRKSVGLTAKLNIDVEIEVEQPEEVI